MDPDPAGFRVVGSDPDPAGTKMSRSGLDPDPAGSKMSRSSLDPDPAGSENCGSGAPLHDTAYEQLGQSSVAWICQLCDGPNYISVLFDLYNSLPSQQSGIDDSTLSLGSLDSHELRNPKHASSPIRPKPQPARCLRPLRIINVNCQLS